MPLTERGAAPRLFVVRKYLTTAIDYPNAAPHMGHVLEKVLADAIARWWRLSGHEVRLQIGTDEHGIKIQQTAKKEGMSPRELVDRNTPLFVKLYEQLNISADYFVRTSDQETHWPTVRELWKRIAANGDMEKRTYTGLYCSGCERFITAKDLVDGKCEIHQRVPEEVSEQNWFFLLSRYQTWVKDLLTREGGYRIVPDFRAPETLQLIEQGLEDVSFSRPMSSLAWGVPVPGEESEQTMYVWCDALTNYVSTLGMLTDERGAQWWKDAEVTHVIGKDIARFHALLWPAMLKSAGMDVPPPHRLLIHGFLTSEGQKMSKSLGNVINPVDVLAKYPVDALRFFLLHEVPVGNDGDFTWKRFAEIYDSKLRNQLGNLLNRILVLLHKDGGALALAADAPEATDVRATWDAYAAHMDRFEIAQAAQVVMKLVDSMNARMNEVQPWKMEGEAKRATLSAFAEQLRHVSLLLLPIIPQTGAAIARQLNVPYGEKMTDRAFVATDELKAWGVSGWASVGQPSILFAPVE